MASSDLLFLRRKRIFHILLWQRHLQGVGPLTKSVLIKRLRDEGVHERMSESSCWGGPRECPPLRSTRASLSREGQMASSCRQVSTGGTGPRTPMGTNIRGCSRLSHKPAQYLHLTYAPPSYALNHLHVVCNPSYSTSRV